VIPHGVEIFVGLEPIDLRWSFDRLAGIVSERIGREARSGALFVFFGKRRDALKVLFFDGTGLCLFYKRLDRGTFRLPEPIEEGATLVRVGTAIFGRRAKTP
jgi:transposase